MSYRSIFSEAKMSKIKPGFPVSDVPSIENLVEMVHEIIGVETDDNDVRNTISAVSELYKKNPEYVRSALSK